MSSYEMSNAIEFIKNRVYYVALSGAPPPSAQRDAHFFSIDKELVYWNFYLDFGPLNLGQMYRFCEMLNRRLEDSRLQGKKIYFYSGTHGNRRANAVTLLCCWGVLYKNMSPEDAFAPFRGEKFPTFHDATPCACPFKLTILDCIKVMYRAMQNDYWNVHTFDVDEFEHFEKVENGDLTWLSKKFIAFAGPHDKRSSSPEGYYNLTPEDYIPYFQKNNVTLVIRLNKKCYDERKFLNAGINHLDLFYTDGSNPPEDILQKFLMACEQTEGVIAVHCKAGLGRTGTTIGAYMMKHDHFTAHELIGWMRLCRPGMVIGPQQQYMEQFEKRLKTGEIGKMSTGTFKPKLSIKSGEKTQGDLLNSAKRHHISVKS